MFVADGAYPIGCPARVFSAAFANFQTAGPTVGASVNNTAQLDPAPATGPVRVRAGVVPIGGRT